MFEKGSRLWAFFVCGYIYIQTQNMKFLLNMLSSGSKVSSKRVVTFIAFVMMCVGYLVDLFTTMTVSDNIYESMQWIVMTGLGFTATEIFKSNKNKEEEEVIN